MIQNIFLQLSSKETKQSINKMGKGFEQTCLQRRPVARVARGQALGTTSCEANTDHSHREMLPHTLGDGHSLKAGQGVLVRHGGVVPSHLDGGNVSCCHCGEQLSTELTRDPAETQRTEGRDRSGSWHGPAHSSRKLSPRGWGAKGPSRQWGHSQP